MKIFYLPNPKKTRITLSISIFLLVFVILTVQIKNYFFLSKQTSANPSDDIKASFVTITLSSKALPGVWVYIDGEKYKELKDDIKVEIKKATTLEIFCEQKVNSTVRRSCNSALLIPDINEMQIKKGIN